MGVGVRRKRKKWEGIQLGKGTILHCHIRSKRGFGIFTPYISPLQLFKNIFSPDIGSSLAFIGFVQPASGGLLSMSETQARWWAELCKENVRLPDKETMYDVIKKEQVNRSFSLRFYFCTAISVFIVTFLPHTPS